MHLHDTLPRRILMTTDTVGGVWTYSRDLSLGLADAGVSVTMVAFGGRADERQRSAVQHSRIHLVDSDLPLEWMPGDWSGVDASCALLRAVAARADPDLVHCNTYVHAALDWRQPVLAVGHSCVYSWFEAVHGSLPPQPQWTRYREGVRAGLQAADLVVTPTAAMRDRLDAFYGPLSDTRIIHNGCADAPVAVRSESPVILAAGRAWDGAKNFAVLDAIAPQLAWPIRIAGDAQGPDGSTAAFDHCQLLGRLSSRRLRRQMAQAGIFAHPARYEPTAARRRCRPSGPPLRLLRHVRSLHGRLCRTLCIGRLSDPGQQEGRIVSSCEVYGSGTGATRRPV
ncbi:MAG: glycosyltransferase family 4 protein [Planctomycetota bacterium]